MSQSTAQDRVAPVLDELTPSICRSERMQESCLSQAAARYHWHLQFSRRPMAILSGKRLGPYEILSAIGAGGMGEVYRARDTRLERIVAVKILPDHLADK